MQDQIERLQAEKGQTETLLSQERQWREAQEQSSLSEISKLQSALQQARKKLQEQSDQIVRLNGADMILQDNIRLKQANQRLQREKEETSSRAGREVAAVKDKWRRKEALLSVQLKEADAKEKTAKDVIRLFRENIGYVRDEAYREAENKCESEYNKKLSLVSDQYGKEKMTLKKKLCLTETFVIMLIIVSITQSATLLNDVIKLIAEVQGKTVWIWERILVVGKVAAGVSNWIRNDTVSGILSFCIRWTVIGGILLIILLLVVFLIIQICKWCQKHVSGFHALVALTVTSFSIIMMEGWIRKIPGINLMVLFLAALMLFMLADILIRRRQRI